MSICPLSWQSVLPYETFLNLFNFLGLFSDSLTVSYSASPFTPLPSPPLIPILTLFTSSAPAELLSTIVVLIFALLGCLVLLPLASKMDWAVVALTFLSQALVILLPLALAKELSSWKLVQRLCLKRAATLASSIVDNKAWQQFELSQRGVPTHHYFELMQFTTCACTTALGLNLWVFG